MKCLVIAAMQSGGGKTSVTAALLAALQKRSLPVRAFKCGPDYLDPMLHQSVVGAASRNLDLFLMGEKALLPLREEAKTYAVIEGVMGYFDGIGGTTENSTFAVAAALSAPVLLVVTPRGESITLAAKIKGLQQFRRPDLIRGILLNRCRPSLYTHLKAVLERETGLPVLGFLPEMAEAAIPSRHLGLYQPGELAEIQKKIQLLAEALIEHTDMEALQGLFAEQKLPEAGENPTEAVGEGERRPMPFLKERTDLSGKRTQEEGVRCAKTRGTIAVARDKAFSFYYESSLSALEKTGAKLVFFSPLADRSLPPGTDGLYIGGGYPELYAEELAENTPMREAVRKAVREGLPTVAECGGFLYLGQTLAGKDGHAYPMAGALPGEGYETPRLTRFGYRYLQAEKDSLLFRKGEKIPCHEFHYWDSTDAGADAAVFKPDGTPSGRAGFLTKTMYASFPHLSFCGEIPLAERFAAAAGAFHSLRCAPNVRP